MSQENNTGVCVILPCFSLALRLTLALAIAAAKVFGLGGMPPETWLEGKGKGGERYENVGSICGPEVDSKCIIRSLPEGKKASGRGTHDYIYINKEDVSPGSTSTMQK